MSDETKAKIIGWAEWLDLKLAAIKAAFSGKGGFWRKTVTVPVKFLVIFVGLTFLFAAVSVSARHVEAQARTILPAWVTYPPLVEGCAKMKPVVITAPKKIAAKK